MFLPSFQLFKVCFFKLFYQLLLILNHYCKAIAVKSQVKSRVIAVEFQVESQVKKSATQVRLESKSSTRVNNSAMYRSSSSIKARINRKIVHAQCAPNFWPTNYLCAQKINPKCTGLSLLIFASWFQLRLCIHAWNGETIITVRKLRPATINMHILFNIYIYIDRYIYVVKWWKRVSCCIIITNLAFPIVPSFTQFIYFVNAFVRK